MVRLRREQSGGPGQAEGGLPQRLVGHGGSIVPTPAFAPDPVVFCGMEEMSGQGGFAYASRAGDEQKTTAILLR